MADSGFAIPDRRVEEWLRLQRVCVTGGRGALGKRLVRQLVTSGVEHVVIFDKRPLMPGDDTLPASVELFTGDILDLTDLERALVNCTVVFHLAALIHVGHSYSEPLQYFEVNGSGTAHVVEACRRQGVRRVVYSSTGHVYGKPRQLPVTEEHPALPLSGYAASKLAGEVVLQGYSASYGISCCIARLSNLYGAFFGSDVVIGCALRQVVSGKPIALHNLAAIRDFVHADDVVEALVRLASAGDRMAGCSTVNVSTGQGVSVREMAELLSGIAAEQGLGLPEILETGNNNNELLPELVLDNGRLRELTGWMPQIALEQGLRLALREFQTQREEQDSRQ